MNESTTSRELFAERQIHQIRYNLETAQGKTQHAGKGVFIGSAWLLLQDHDCRRTYFVQRMFTSGLHSAV